MDNLPGFFLEPTPNWPNQPTCGQVVLRREKVNGMGHRLGVGRRRERVGLIRERVGGMTQMFQAHM